MKTLFAAATAAALVAGAGFAQAQTPGHEMQQKGSVKGTTGASGYAPGIQMQEKGSVSGTTGASGYAPGQTRTDINGNAGVKAGHGGAKLGVGVGAGGKVK